MAVAGVFTSSMVQLRLSRSACSSRQRCGPPVRSEAADRAIRSALRTVFAVWVRLFDQCKILHWCRVGPWPVCACQLEECSQRYFGGRASGDRVATLKVTHIKVLYGNECARSSPKCDAAPLLRREDASWPRLYLGSSHTLMADSPLPGTDFATPWRRGDALWR